MATPSAPNIYFRPLTLSNSVELYWYPPINEANITSYIVECSNISYINVLPSTDRKTIIRNLVTGNSYVFTLKATNINGNGNIASFNLIMPGFKSDPPTNLDFTTNISNVSKYSMLNLNFNNPIYTGNSNIIYNVATMIPVDVTGNVLQNSQFKKNHSNEGTNNMDPFSYDDFNTNYNYKTYIQSINTVSGSDFKYYDNIINPSLPTNGLKLWLDPYDVSTITLSNNKVINWQDKSKNKANASITNTFYPSSISSLQLWLDGNDTSGNATIPLNGSTISTWFDKSNFKNNAIQYATSGMPTFVSSSFNSKGGINFTGTQMLVLSNAIPQISTIFVVGRQASTAGNFITGKDSSNTGHSPYYIALRSVDSAFTLTKTDGTTINSTALPTVNNTVYLLTGFNDGTNVTAILNGGTNTVTQSYSGHLRTAIQTYLGVNWYNGSFYYPGCEFNEIIIYNTAISQSEREKVEGYLAWKWGLQSNLPSNHPWKNTNPSASILNESQAPTYDSSNALINFNGNQYLNLPANTLPSANSSYSIFTYVSTSNISKNGHWFLYSGTPTANLSLGGYINSNSIVHSWYSNDQMGNSNISTNISYLLELTYDAGIRKTYLNGNLIAQNNDSIRNSTSANNLIGTNGTLTGNLEGSIGDIIIYNRILNTHERASVKNYLERKKYNLALNNIGNVVTWLDASDPNQLYDANNEIKVSYNNKVYNWNDRSYANNNATQSNVSVLPIRRPYIQNNLDVLEFNNSYLTIPSSYYPLDAFMVLKLNYNITSNGIIGVSPNSNNYSSLSLTGNKWSIDATSNSIISSNTESSANFLLMEWSIGNNNNFIKRYGSNIANSSIGTWSLPNNANIIIGNSNGFNFNNSFKGYIGEIILFNKQLGDDYRYPIEGYLAWKWGLQSYLSADHPYKNSAPYLFPRYLSANPIIYSLLAPNDISGLQIWYDVNDASTLFADTNATTLATTGNTIARINDKSGNSNYLYQNTSGSRPLYQQFNSKSGLYFTNGKQLQSINNNITIGNNPRTVFALIYCPSDTSRLIIGTGLNAVNTPPTAFGIDLVNFGNLLYYPYVYNSSDNTKSIKIKTLTLIQIDYSNGLMSGKHNFENIKTNTSASTLNTISSPWYFGSRPDGETSGDSYMCEFLQYNRILSIQEIQQIEGYIAWKWGITSDLPSNHPYKILAPTRTVAPINTFSPLSINSMQVWLDSNDPLGTNTTPSNGTQITTWYDKSGNNKNATASDTNGVYDLTTKSIRLNSSTYTFALPDSSANETIFFVFKVDSSYFLNILPTNGGGRQIAPTNDMGITNFFSVASYAVSYGSITSDNTIVPNEITLGTYVNTNSSTFVSVDGGRANGTIVPLGYSSNGSITKIVGIGSNVYEFIAFNRALSTNERQEMEGYLAWKWGIQSNLPSDHPYKTVSPSLTQVLTPVLNFDPTGINGLQLWLDANDSSSFILSGNNVNTWYDKSGNRYHATGINNPQYVSGSYVSFNGTNQYFTLPNNALPYNNSAYSYFAIATFNVSGPNILFFGGTWGTSNSVFIWGTDTSNQTRTLWWGPDYGTDKTPFTNSQMTYINNFYDGNGNRTMGISFDPNNVTSSYTSETRTQTNNNNTIGSIVTSNQYMNGRIHEIIVYNNKLNIIDTQKIEGYLAWKWGLQSNLPSNHPYKNYRTNPLNITGLQLWLDASDLSSIIRTGINVTQWNDKSGNGNNAIAATTTYPIYSSNSLNSNGTIQLGNNSDYFTVSNYFTVASYPSLCYFIILKPYSSQANNTYAGILSTDTDGMYGRSLAFNATSGKYQVEYYNGFVYPTSYSINSWQLVSLQYSPSEVTLYVNGVSYATGIQQGTGTNTESFKIGTYNFTFPQYSANFDVAEILVYGSIVSTSDRQKIEGYLAWKWGLQSNLPSNHPYKNSAP